MQLQNTIAAATLLLSGVLCLSTAGQSVCREHSSTAAGQVMDASGAVIENATVSIEDSSSREPLHTARDGRFTTACLPDGTYTATIEADGFETATRKLEVGPASHPLAVRLKVLTVNTEVDAAPEDSGVSADDIAGSRTLKTADISQLADDPDEFSRQLQVLAAAAGGAPGAAIVTVDGFQNGGQIPPKSAIAFIRVNPDLFSAEYARPPYRGGRVEIYTKPGQAKYHGALFTTQSAGFMNAEDPFSPGRAAIGKQRYGFELSGPIAKNRSDFALALEHRQISQFAVVDAVTLNSAGAETPVSANVAAPRSLWETSARFGYLLSPKNNLTATYTSNVNELSNQGVGGNVLAEAGYNTNQSEQVFQAANL